MPCGIMAAFAVVCGILFFLLPETHNKPMPDTINQVDSSIDVLMENDEKKKGLTSSEEDVI